MSDVPRSSRSQSRASERSPPTMSTSTNPKQITAKPQPMGPPPAPLSGAADDDDDDFDFMSKIPSPVVSLPSAPRAKSGGTQVELHILNNSKHVYEYVTQPKRKKPVFEDFMDLIPASQNFVDRWPAPSGDSTADDSPPPAAGARSKEPIVSDTMEVDGGDNEARTTIPSGPAGPRNVPKAQPIVQDKALVPTPRGHTLGTALQNPFTPAGPSAGPSSSGQPKHPMGIVIPPSKKPQDITDLEERTEKLKIHLARLWDTLTLLRGAMAETTDDMYKAVVEIEAIASYLG
ncbi:hypothetical protein EDB85DRAFT_2159344 [Lactarius pseudohatsudake]|nr:hypothetical protein EDB85DRAFT_2159344 [Lactarius pseudohatsudake]